MHKKLSKRKEYPVIIQNTFGFVLSSVIGIITTFIISIFLTLILNKSEYLPQKLNLYLSFAVVLGSLISGFISSFKCSLKGILSGLASAIPLSLFITVALLFFSDGKIISETGFLYLVIFIFSSLGGILGANTKRRK